MSNGFYGRVIGMVSNINADVFQDAQTGKHIKFCSVSVAAGTKMVTISADEDAERIFREGQLVDCTGEIWVDHTKKTTKVRKLVSLKVFDPQQQKYIEQLAPAQPAANKKAA